MKKIRTSVELFPGQSRKLQAIAKGKGYCQTRGAGKADKIGSIAQLMQAEADGVEVVISAVEFARLQAENAKLQFRVDELEAILEND